MSLFSSAQATQKKKKINRKYVTNEKNTQIENILQMSLFANARNTKENANKYVTDEKNNKECYTQRKK
jgi:hypothetical protein